MTRKKKESDIFEGTFLEGLMSLEEAEVNEKLKEVSEKDQILGDLLPIEIKLLVLTTKKSDECIKIINGHTLLDLKTSDEILKHLSKIVVLSQQNRILTKLLWMSISRHLNSGFISLFNVHKSIDRMEIRKGFKVAAFCNNNGIAEEKKWECLKAIEYLEYRWRKVLSNDETVVKGKDKEMQIEKFLFLIGEWKRILCGGLI